MHRLSYFVGMAAGAMLAAVALMILARGSHQHWPTWVMALLLLIAAGLVGAGRPRAARPRAPRFSRLARPIVRTGPGGDFVQDHHSL